MKTRGTWEQAAAAKRMGAYMPLHCSAFALLQKASEA